MGVRAFHGNGWGFGGTNLGFAGLGVGGGCGVGLGLGWGHGIGLGAQYINMSPEFTESKSHRPNVFQQVSYFVRRVSTLNRGLGP
ncbi:hypothetical protein APUTEX25_004893 [Auxenochlorella protothecoides]|uniref:Protein TRIGALACTOSYLDIACYLGLYCEROL 5, chloroplastic n=1 Tax=Auxenochlorella protothecoides TaxID=3075 RepID=A0A3M7KUL3_AUXPR|nr:hypothetical protein APUTEX25_004893 [Auxenochlorella protothecoides]|eukprot:RMZ53405.1 hypothetical protein APUTEX25_004893 [Auxenochlorella protothecoides]